MTYRELDAAANRLAHLLTGLGWVRVSGWGCVAPVGRGDCGDRGRPEDGGGVCADGSGAPAGAVEFLLEDAAPVAAVTTAGLAERLDGRELLVVDVNDPAIAAQPHAPLPVPRRGDRVCDLHLGYYRVPKGVAIAHGNVTRLLATLDAELGLSAGQVWTQCHSLAFDFSCGRFRRAAARWPAGGGF
ncbi:AMP-binding enzyme family protein [Mycobacterium xenopi 4042]|uniref:AMP-binding enzyme family protein n=1 Tax=Mycobacterium xenopi 4042 TaxID=1299334 RepID=X8CN55_MYCXE|nr:AMP-binding enzyme family protein [Mycobacterium xenopi 4042]